MIGNTNKDNIRRKEYIYVHENVQTPKEQKNEKKKPGNRITFLPMFFVHIR